MVIVHGSVPVRPERQEAVTAAGARFQRLCRTEPGCIDYRLSWELGDSCMLHLQESWEDEAAHLVHVEQPHVIEWAGLIREAAEGPPAFSRYVFEGVAS